MRSGEIPLKQVVIFGAGGQARCAVVCLTKDSPYEVVAFTAHEAYIEKGKMLGLDVVPFERIEELYPPERYAMFVAIGFERVNRTRAEVYEDCKRKGYELVSYISSNAIHRDEIEVGENCFIGEGTVIHPFAKIGNNVSIGDHCFLAAHTVVLGCVTVEPYCLLGANSTINNGITIARECVVGAGTFISNSTQEKSIYVNREAELLPRPSNLLGTWLTWSAGVNHNQNHKKEKQF
jgi:sugar O-acyltransferase (sialic acid O-acetyltransferase NeuD family)